MNQKTSDKALIILFLILLMVGLGAPWATNLYYVNIVSYKAYLVSFLLLGVMPIYWFTSYKIGAKVFELSQSQFYLILFFIFASVSFIWADDATLFLGKWYLYVFGFLSFYLAMKVELSSNNYINIALALAFISAAVSILGVFQYLFEFPSQTLLPYDNIPASTFGNKNAANQMLVLTFPAIVFLLVSKINRYQFIFAVMALFATLFYVYYATTKSVWIALSVEVLLMAIYFMVNKKYFIVKPPAFFKLTVFSMVLAIFLSLDFASDRSTFGADSKVDSVLTTLSDRYQGSDSPRKRIWKSAFEIANKSPVFGHGLGNFAYELSVEGSKFRLKKVHNDLLEMYVELGLVGVLLFSFFSFYFIKDWILINKNNTKKDSTLFNFLMIALVGSFINMMFSWPFQTVYGIVLFSIFTALIINKASNNKKVVSYKFNNFFRLSSILAIFLILLFSFLSLNSWTNNLSNFYYNSGMHGHKFKSSKLVEYAENIQNQDIHLSKVAERYWKAGYFDRASEVYSIATKYNKNNMLAQYRQFITAIDQSLINKAQSLLLVMQKNNKLHPLTFRASVNFYRAKGDIVMAKESYYFYKKYFNNLYNIDKRAAKTLHHWSIILGIYKDTPGLYEAYIGNFPKNVIVENNMANFYTYTQQYLKSVVHMTYVLKNKPDLIKPDVLKILQDKGFIKK